MDIIELPILFALQKEGITIVDGQQFMSGCRVIKTQDEISLLNTSAMMVDAAPSTQILEAVAQPWTSH
ncbi:MAG TPA: hypothetical protein VNE63_12490 [Candidatus Acidoferrales bacterium]|nr:hypothetical protein [Candidatus Acidoferrales bacterium]